MAITFWLSIGLGVAIGGLYGLTAYVTMKLALRHEGQRFLALLTGGMIARMILILVSVGAVLALATVEPIPFVAALVVCFLGGLVLEAWMAYRHITGARAT